MEDLGIIPKQHHPRVNPLQAMKLRHAQQQPGLPSHVCLGSFEEVNTWETPISSRIYQKYVQGGGWKGADKCDTRSELKRQ